MNAEVPTPEEIPAPDNDINENDRLMAALSYPIPIVAIVILLSETNKVRPFQKFHAVQSLAYWVPLGIIGIVLSTVTCGLSFIIVWLVSFWPAYKAYQGEYMELPVLTDFIRNQGWV
jgi:uncharacterized membrane protein